MTREYREYAKSRIEYLLKICRLDERDKEALEVAIKALSQEPCDDTVSIRKDVLKCRVGKLVVYNVEWLKKHWQMEMDIVCGAKPCDDVISREDAEQMFRNIRSHLKPQDYKSAEEFNTRDLMLLNAEQMIHALPSVTQKSGKWIPVSERLPEDAQEVLYSTKTGCVFHGEYYDDNTDRKWFSYKDDIFSFNNVVNAWMPLPKPYKAESEDR